MTSATSFTDARPIEKALAKRNARRAKEGLEPSSAFVKDGRVI